MIHIGPSPIAGKTVRINETLVSTSTRFDTFNLKDNEPAEFHVIDWYDRVFNQSWIDSPVSLEGAAYAFAAAQNQHDLYNNDVLFGHVGDQPALFNVRELLIDIGEVMDQFGRLHDAFTDVLDAIGALGNHNELYEFGLQEEAIDRIVALIDIGAPS